MTPLMTPGAAAERLIRLRDQRHEDHAGPSPHSDRAALAMGANAVTALDDLLEALDRAAVPPGFFGPDGTARRWDVALKAARDAVGR